MKFIKLKSKQKTEKIKFEYQLRSIKAHFKLAFTSTIIIALFFYFLTQALANYNNNVSPTRIHLLNLITATAFSFLAAYIFGKIFQNFELRFQKSTWLKGWAHLTTEERSVGISPSIAWLNQTPEISVIPRVLEISNKKIMIYVPSEKIRQAKRLSKKHKAIK
jgi:hypothetical protein